MKYQISHHQVEGTNVTPIKDIVFVMDAPKEDEKVKSKKAKNKMVMVAKHRSPSKTSVPVLTFRNSRALLRTLSCVGDVALKQLVMAPRL